MKEDVAQLKAQYELTPGLAVVLVGDDPASMSYVSGKRKACDEIGIFSHEEKFDADLSQSGLLEVIDRLNQDDRIHGILVQLPLPGGLDENAALNALDPDKDVDGLHPVNLGRLMRQEPGFWALHTTWHTDDVAAQWYRGRGPTRSSSSVAAASSVGR